MLELKVSKAKGISGDGILRKSLGAYRPLWGSIDPYGSP
nr:MAG TPA: hypothetical protein [Caudoviricetes sp.]